MVPYSKNLKWMAFRVVKRCIAYLLVGPVLLIFAPFVAIGNMLGLAFNKLRYSR